MQQIYVSPQWFRGWAQIIAEENHQILNWGKYCVLLFKHHLCKQLGLSGWAGGFIERSGPVLALPLLDFHACLSVSTCVLPRVYLWMCEPCLCFRLSSRQFAASHQQLSAIDCVFSCREMEPAGYFGIILWTKMKVRRHLEVKMKLSASSVFVLTRVPVLTATCASYSGALSQFLIMRGLWCDLCHICVVEHWKHFVMPL